MGIPHEDVVAQAKRVLAAKKIVLSDKLEPFSGVVDIAKAGLDAFSDVSTVHD